MMKDYIFFHIPDRQEIEEAAARIAPHIHRTPLLHSEKLDELAGCRIFFKAENLQKAGAFKSRGAVNAVLSLSKKEALFGVCTHSSGNHAQALARAAALQGMPAYIVMPDNAPRVKVEAVKAYGGKITFCPPTLHDRETTLKQVITATKATEIHPYDNLKVIEGQATAAREIFEDLPHPDYLIAARHFSPATGVIAAEPQGADDAFRSFRGRKFFPSVNPQTMADGLLTSLGKYSFPIMLRYVDDVMTVTEEQIVEAMKLIYSRLKTVVEPSGAVGLAAVLAHKEKFRDKTLAVILSGGNIDLNQLKSLF